MDKKILEKLNYYEIKEELKTYALSELGKKLIDKLHPETEYKPIIQKIKKTTEAVNILREGSSIPMYGLASIDVYLEKSNKGIVLKPSELLQIADFLRGCRAVKSHMTKYEFVAPILYSYSLVIEEYKDLEKEISNMIVGSGVRKDATNKLNKLYKQKTVLDENIEKRLNKLIKSPVYKSYLQENFVSKRNDRFVIPVKAAYKNKIDGKIIEKSSTGATIFIEPKSIEKLTAELDRLNNEIEEEIYQILSSLTSYVQMHEDGLMKNLEVMSEYDFAFAKGKYSLDIEGIEPNITQNDEIIIMKGKHPLLGKKVVPLDFEIGDKYRTLLITGPNTGGKTVVLKTIGLFMLMVQSGLHIPARLGTTFPVFNNLFIDIGDEQNLKNSLSTFSAHMKNLVEISNKAKPGTLILLDEIGTGTDPREGAALGAAILEDLYKSGAITVVTTHYGKLKEFSEKVEGFENAKMLFNSETLEPYYILKIGDSGESNALWISEKLGLKKTILKRTEEFLGYENNTGVYKVEDIDYKKKKLKILKEKKEYSKLYQGDLVLCLDDNEKAVVFEDVDDFGNVIVSRDYEYLKIHRKRIKLLMKAKDLYPEGYDKSQLFETFGKRKLEKDISKGRFKNLKELKERIDNQNNR